MISPKDAYELVQKNLDKKKENDKLKDLAELNTMRSDLESQLKTNTDYEFRFNAFCYGVGASEMLVQELKNIGYDAFLTMAKLNNGYCVRVLVINLLDSEK